MEHTMMTFKDNELCPFMSKEEIRAKAPYIFADAPTNPNVSKRYTFANTETIIDDLAKLGWGVVDCKQQRANKRSNIRSFHMVALQNKDIYVTENDEIVGFPRIIVQNSHDGFNSFKFMVGFFRLCCQNGLVIATEQFANIAIRHSNYTFDELRTVVGKAIMCVSDNIGTMNDMQNTILTAEQKNEFAVAALRIRNGVKDDETFKVDGYDIEDILTPMRDEDKGDSLWTVFNVLQEKIIKGEFNMNSPTNGRQRKARAIKGIAKDVEINQKLFRTAYSYCRMAM